MEIYILDRLINKPILLELNKDNINLNPGDKVVYYFDNPHEKLVGIYLGHYSETLKKGNFIGKLSGYEERKFNEGQVKAKKLYDLFKKDFKANFTEAIPVNSRISLNGDTIYFYFYAEKRFNFTDFVKEFRKKISINFFLFQVGIRERVRMDPESDNVYGACGQQLCCKIFKCTLPTVDSDNINLQNLEYRGLEKLKGVCSKLKCCLNYEKSFYEEEMKKFPEKSKIFEYKKCNYKCLSFNIMNGEVIAQNIETHEIEKIPNQEIKKIIKK